MITTPETSADRVVLKGTPDRTGRTVWSMTVYEGDETTRIELPAITGQGLRAAYRAAERYLVRDGYQVTRWHTMTGQLTTI